MINGGNSSIFGQFLDASHSDNAIEEEMYEQQSTHNSAARALAGVLGRHKFTVYLQLLQFRRQLSC
jgi:hypothetical protein